MSDDADYLSADFWEPTPAGHERTSNLNTSGLRALRYHGSVPGGFVGTAGKARDYSLGRFFRFVPPMLLINYSAAMLLWVVVASLPLVVTAAYMSATSRDLSVVQRLAVSAHGVALSALGFAALLVSIDGTPQQSNWDIFGPVCSLPLVLISYSLLKFAGRRWVHALQLVNVAWLLAFLVFGRMAVTGTWL